MFNLNPTKPVEEVKKKTPATKKEKIQEPIEVVKEQKPLINNADKVVIQQTDKDLKDLLEKIVISCAIGTENTKKISDLINIISAQNQEHKVETKEIIKYVEVPKAIITAVGQWIKIRKARKNYESKENSTEKDNIIECEKWLEMVKK